jgi:hypothetical protein
MIARSLLSCACCLAIAQERAWCRDPDPSQGAFAMAEYVPADVTTFVNVTGGAHLRSELTRFPLGTWLTHWTVSPDLAKAWSSLAASAKVSSSELFDQALGEGFTLAVRGKGAAAEWAIISRMDAQRAKALLSSLAPRLVDLWQGMPVFDLPEHQLLVARHEDMLLIGPRGTQRKLFESVCNAVVNDLEDSLAVDEAFESASEIGGGSLFVFVRHEAGGSQPSNPRREQEFQLASNHTVVNGGDGAPHAARTSNWTAVSASLKGNELMIRHASSQPIVRVGHIEHVAAWDMAPLKALGEQNVLALIKSVNQNPGIIEQVVDESLGGAKWLATLEAQDVGRRILVVDDTGGEGTGDKPASVIVARAVELGCDEAEVRQVVLKLQGMNARISNLDCGAYLVQSNSSRDIWLTSRSFQEYAQDEVSAIFRGLPVMEPRPLQWMVAEGPDANWCVMSNDQEKMLCMATALAAAAPEPSASIGAWLSCGSGDGRRLAETLRKLVEAGGKMPQQLKGMTNNEALVQLAAVAGVVDQFRWSLARTDEDLLTLEVVLKLSEIPVKSQAR